MGESHLAVLRGRGGPRGVHVGPCSHRQRLLALASARSRGEWGDGEARVIGGVGGWYRGVVGWGTGESHLRAVRGREGPRGVHVGPCSHRQRLLALASARSRGEWGGGEAREIGGVGGWYRGVVGWGTGESHLAVLRGRGGPRGVHVGPCSHRQQLLALASGRNGTARVLVEMALLAHRRSALRRRSRGRGRWTAAAGR